MKAYISQLVFYWAWILCADTKEAIETRTIFFSHLDTKTAKWMRNNSEAAIEQ